MAFRLSSLLALGALLAIPALAAPMDAATPESQGISSRAILKFVDACEKAFPARGTGAFHGFVIVRHGRVIAEGSWKPFDTLHETHMLYSHSKSFTATAVGLAADDGLLDIDERVVDIFSNKCPAKVSANLAQLRVRDLLTMNAGKADHLVKRLNVDWIEYILKQRWEKKPGTFYRYDSDATYMLAAIVELKTGKKMMDYLKTRIFDRIGITSAWTTTSPQGIPCGGWGMNMTTRDLARFGQLYLNEGRWNNEQILSRDWVRLATSKQTWSGWNGKPGTKVPESDWYQGYGFQFWCCRHNAYRADGAAGQYTVVLPDQDAVVSIHAGLDDMQTEIQLIWNCLLPEMKAKPLPEDPAAQAELTARLKGLAIKPVPNTATAVPAFLGKTFALKENARKLKSVRIDPASKGWTCTLVTPAGEQRFPIGAGEWARGRIRVDTETFEGLGAYIGEHTTQASGGVTAPGAFRVKVYFTADTGWLEFDFTEKDGALACKGLFWGMGGCALTGTVAK